MLRNEQKEKGKDEKINTAESALVSLVDLLKAVKTDTKESKLNEWSMSDNNGGRIYF